MTPSAGAAGGSWTQPRLCYANTNMQAQLPAPIDPTGRADTMLILRVGDDFADGAPTPRCISLRVRLTAHLSVELRLNGAFVQAPEPTTVRASRAGNADAGASTGVVTVDSANLLWTEWSELPSRMLAAGDNLISLRLVGERAGSAIVAVENVELHVMFA